MSLFNPHYDKRCFLPILIYDADTGHCVLTVLRPGKMPDGEEARGHPRRLVRRIRMHWPHTQITFRGDSHGACPQALDPGGRKEATDWCERNGVNYIFSRAPNNVLAEQIFPKLDECCDRRAIGQLHKVRDFTTTRCAAKSWSRLHRVVARIEATRDDADVRYVVTNLKRGIAKHLYEDVYRARGRRRT